MVTNYRRGWDRGAHIHSLAVELVWFSVPLRWIKRSVYNVVSLKL